MIKFVRKLCTMAMAAVLFSFGITVYAHDAVDMTAKGSVTILMKYNGLAISGGSFSLLRVGDIKEEDGNYSFSLAPGLGLDIKPEDLNSEESALKILSAAEDAGLVAGFSSAAMDGKASFNDLPVGLYLAKQDAASPGYEAVKPFLISVPKWTGTHYSYNITAKPKTELNKQPSHDDPTPPEKPKQQEDPPQPPAPDIPSKKPMLPQTGRNGFIVPLLLVMGGVLLATGLTIRKKNDA